MLQQDFSQKTYGGDQPVLQNNVSPFKSGGREGIRTPGLLVANEALSQLSYSPTSSEKILADATGLANPIAMSKRGDD